MKPRILQENIVISANRTDKVIKIKLYYFKDRKSRNLSEFEAYKIREDVDEFVSLKKYDYLRTNQFVIYNPNKRTRTRQSIKIRRALAVLARQNGGFIKYDEKLNVAFTKNESFIFADRVQTDDERDYHLNKFIGLKNPKVISLIKSNICLYIDLDTKTIYNYYKKYAFPDWFRKFLKMRAVRAFSSMGFNFNTRRYTDTKWTAEQKFKHDFINPNLDIHKVYFTLARVLDSKLDSCGKGFPLSGLIYLALDIDGKCEGSHLINETGICVKCLKNSNEKLMKALKKINDIPELHLVKRLFSGTKGWHLHLEYKGKREINEAEIREIIGKINSEENLVDWFDGKEKEGIRQFDLFRIFKLPGSLDSTTACLVDEEIKRLDVNDNLSRNFQQS